jgi:hypothetical protein
MGTEVIRLKDAAVASFLKRAHAYRFHEESFFIETVNFAIQWGGMEPEDIGGPVRVTKGTVIAWKNGAVPGEHMRYQVATNIVSALKNRAST